MILRRRNAGDNGKTKASNGETPPPFKPYHPLFIYIQNGKASVWVFPHSPAGVSVQLLPVCHCFNKKRPTLTDGHVTSGLNGIVDCKDIVAVNTDCRHSIAMTTHH